MTSLPPFLPTFALGTFLHTLAIIVVAFALGLAIGFERQWRQRTAGLRTNVLVGHRSGLFPEAAALTTAVLAGNTLLRPLVNWINHRPITAAITEAEYRVHAACAHDAVSEVRDLLDVELDRAHFPIREVETPSDSEDRVELAAILVPTTAEDAELDAAVAALARSPLVQSATWGVETTS